MSDFEVESMNGADPVGISTGDEPDMGADERAVSGKDRIADARFDPSFLWAEIKSADWRIGSTTNALGLSHPAVQNGGLIDFFSPVPVAGHSNFAGDSGGGKAPWPFRAVKMGLELLCPPTPTSIRLIPAVGDPYTIDLPSHSQMLGEIILRGKLTMEYGEIPVLKDLPCSLLGAMGGVFHQGDKFGTSQNMQPQWTNAFKLPDEWIFDPASGSGLKAWITLNPGDLAMLGTFPATGWGQPFAMQRKIEDGAPNAPQVTAEVAPLFFGARLAFWGQRGLNIRTGKSSMSRATAARR